MQSPLVRPSVRSPRSPIQPYAKAKPQTGDKAPVRHRFGPAKLTTSKKTQQVEVLDDSMRQSPPDCKSSLNGALGTLDELQSLSQQRLHVANYMGSAFTESLKDSEQGRWRRQTFGKEERARLRYDQQAQGGYLSTQ